MRIAFANTPARYGAVSIFLHWATAALVFALLGLGWYMVRLPDAGFDDRKIFLILAHKSIGMDVLLLVALRMLWRTAAALPKLADGIAEWQQVAARFVHLCFYALLIALPATGWLMSSAGGFPVYLFVDEGQLPDLIRVNPAQFRFYIDLHRWLAWALVGLIGVHSVAALFHHYVRRDDTLRKILP